MSNDVIFRHRPAATTATKGFVAEARAEKFLRSKGLQTSDKNYRCKSGEIDLIMRDGDTLVFVEVRLRSNRRFETAAESVNFRKQLKIINAAQHYLLEKRLTDKLPCRFDVVAISNELDNEHEFEWITNAFGTN